MWWLCCQQSLLCIVLALFFFFLSHWLLLIWILNVWFFLLRHERLTSAAPCDRFPHLCLFFSCRKTDRVHHKTTASSHLLPLLNWQMETTKLPLGLTPSLTLSSSLSLHSFAASLFSFSPFITFLLCSWQTIKTAQKNWCGSTLSVDKLDETL